MNSKHRTHLALVLLFLPLLVAARCNKKGLPAEIETFSATVSLFNSSSSDSLHILAPGESFAPANKIAPSGFRRVTMTLEHLQSYEFRAGQNGVVRGTGTCTVDETAESSDAFFVTAFPSITQPWGFICAEGFH